jgi:hypothetical protein
MLPNAMNLANLEDEAHCLQYLFDEIERIKYEHIKEYFCLIL